MRGLLFLTRLTAVRLRRRAGNLRTFFLRCLLSANPPPARYSVLQQPESAISPRVAFVTRGSLRRKACVGS
jgi:hypothetical protein